MRYQQVIFAVIAAVAVEGQAAALLRARVAPDAFVTGQTVGGVDDAAEAGVRQADCRWTVRQVALGFQTQHGAQLLAEFDQCIRKGAVGHVAYQNSAGALSRSTG